jgi:hypothetical protein
MARTTRPATINLARQYDELDHLLADVNDVMRQAESIYSRGISAEADLYTAIESIRVVRWIVRSAIDQTGVLIDEASE